jgi:hypothetical protein
MFRTLAGSLVRRPQILLLALAVLAGAGDAAAQKKEEFKGAKIKIENNAEKKRKIVQVTLVPKGKSQPAETINVNIEVEPNGSYTIQSSMFDKAELSQVVWDSPNGIVPLPVLTSTQDFALDTHALATLRWTLMGSADAKLRYGFTRAALAASLPVPEGQQIQVVGGLDQSGFFPPEVVFRDAVTLAPYTGLLTSGGEMTASNTWSGLGASLAPGGPLLEGSGDLTAGGSIELTLGGAQPGASAVLVLGFEQLNLPFAYGTLGPAPQVVLGGLAVDAEGGHVLSFDVPGIRPGLVLYAQEVVFAPDGGVAATNTVEGYAF